LHTSTKRSISYEKAIAPLTMTTLPITLPDTLTAYLQEQIDAGNYPTPSDYIQALIQQDQARKSQEALLLEALDSGSATPMTDQDWDTIRATVRQNLTSGELHD
jgi:antitoxin ParD1/3/4